VGVAVVLILAAVFVVARGGDDGGDESTTGSSTTVASTSPTTAGTTPTTAGTTTTTGDPNTVSSGALSFDRQGDPWQDIALAGSLPQGEIVDFAGQEAATAEGSDWYSTLLVGSLGEPIPYDGEASLPDATHALADSLIANYYRGGVTDRRVQHETEVNPDGNPGYFVHYELTIDLPDVEDDREKMIVVVVDTGGDRPAAFWGSIPYSREDLNSGLDAAYASLAVP
jgi:hypothetical protein